MGFWSFVTGTDLEAEQAKGDALDAQLKAANEKAYAPGGSTYNRIAESQGDAAALLDYSAVQQHEDTGKTGDVTQQVEDAASDSIKSQTKAVSVGTGKVLGFLTGLIPWYGWVAIIVVGVIYFKPLIAPIESALFKKK